MSPSEASLVARVANAWPDSPGTERRVTSARCNRRLAGRALDHDDAEILSAPPML